MHFAKILEKTPQFLIVFLLMTLPLTDLHLAGKMHRIFKCVFKTQLN